MNIFLKALIQELYDLEQLGELAVEKKWAALVSAGIKCGMDLPAVISSVGSAEAELVGLVGNPAADADLLGFVTALLKDSGKSGKVISAAADLALSALQLEPKVLALIAAVKA